MAKRIFTAANARDEKREAELPALARAQKLQEAESQISAILAANPQIGVLQGGRGRLFYVASPYREANHPSLLIAEG
jgi:hypothetical protein